MAINFEHEIKGDTLYVTTTGIDDNLEEVASYGRALLAIAKETGCKQILADERELIYTLSDVDTFLLAEGASQEARSLRKIAVVCDSKFLDDGKFYETVTTNRWLKLLVTDDYAQAKAWLD
jgi:hypothetical protein